MIETFADELERLLEAYRVTRDRLQRGEVKRAQLEPIRLRLGELWRAPRSRAEYESACARLGVPVLSDAQILQPDRLARLQARHFGKFDECLEDRLAYGRLLGLERG